MNQTWNLGTTRSTIGPTPIKSIFLPGPRSRRGRTTMSRSSVAKTVLDGSVPMSGVEGVEGPPRGRHPRRQSGDRRRADSGERATQVAGGRLDAPKEMTELLDLIAHRV